MRAYVMVGAPGSGKSTHAHKLAQIENAVVISGDDIRAELYGSADIQGNWAEIHDRIEELVAQAGGKPVILDGTHYRASYRKEAIALLKSYGYNKIEAVVLETSLANCLARNSRRERNVPEHIIQTMHQKLQASLKTIDQENWDHITYVY